MGCSTGDSVAMLSSQWKVLEHFFYFFQCFSGFSIIFNTHKQFDQCETNLKDDSTNLTVRLTGAGLTKCVKSTRAACFCDINHALRRFGNQNRTYGKVKIPIDSISRWSICRAKKDVNRNFYFSCMEFRRK